MKIVNVYLASLGVIIYHVYFDAQKSREKTFIKDVADDKTPIDKYDYISHAECQQ